MKPISNKSLVGALKELTISTFSEENGHLIFVESKKNLKFPIERVFVVYAGRDQIRGQHAHKECHQFLICLQGEVDVNCNDGKSISMLSLKNPTQGILIPPGIWAEQIYKQENSILMVLCDREYDEGDYIRDFDEFLLFAEKLQHSKDKNRNG